MLIVIPSSLLLMSYLLLCMYLFVCVCVCMTGSGCHHRETAQFEYARPHADKPAGRQRQPAVWVQLPLIQPRHEESSEHRCCRRRRYTHVHTHVVWKSCKVFITKVIKSQDIYNTYKQGHKLQNLISSWMRLVPECGYLLTCSLQPRFCADYNELWGTTVSTEFSQILKVSLEKLKEKIQLCVCCVLKNFCPDSPKCNNERPCYIPHVTPGVYSKAVLPLSIIKVL